MIAQLANDMSMSGGDILAFALALLAIGFGGCWFACARRSRTYDISCHCGRVRTRKVVLAHPDEIDDARGWASVLCEHCGPPSSRRTS